MASATIAPITEVMSSSHINSAPRDTAVTDLDPPVIYKDLPSFVKVAYTASIHGQDRGRGLVATELLPVGSIFNTSPVVKVLDDNELEHRCSHCMLSGEDLEWEAQIDNVSSLEADNGGIMPASAVDSFFVDVPGKKRPAPLKRCAGCRIVHYCSSDCQKQECRLHKLECTALKLWPDRAPAALGCHDKVPRMATRGIARLVWLKTTLKGDDPAWNEVMTMQSPLDENDAMLKSNITSICKYLTVFVGREELLEIFDDPDQVGLLALNSSATGHVLNCVSGSKIGFCWAPPITVINHSCEPNTRAVFSYSSRSEPTLRLEL
ncbi:hypothetical protein ACM66B_004376 [Microbotryomycetes sp. NB124-2]